MWLPLLACATKTPDDTAPADDTGMTTHPDDAPVPTEVIGRVEIVELPAQPWAYVAVTLRAGPLPTTQAEVARDGDCAVLDGALTNTWECSPECVWGEQSCIDGVCVDWPAMAPTGDVTIAGLIPGDVTLPELDLGYYGTPAGYDGDLFDAGDPIRVTSEGGATPALDLAATGVEDLDMTVEPIEPGEPMTLTWTPSDGPGTVQVLLETGWHGANSLTTIWCETADDGELTVSGELTGRFEIPSCGECEQSRARRLTRDVVDFGAGPVELLVASEHRFVAWW
jgi:hypothetical protein